MRKYGLCGLGNSIVDILVNVTDQELAELPYPKASMQLVDQQSQTSLLKRVEARPVFIASGGSVANSTITFAQLGGASAFMGCVGDDRYGLHYLDEFSTLGINFVNKPLALKTTGTSLIHISPDAERTMCTHLGVSAEISAKQVEEEVVAQSEWLFVEGYLFGNPDFGHEAVYKALEYTKRYRTKLVLTFSDVWVVESQRKLLEQAVTQADLIFANEKEAMAYTGKSSAGESFEVLSKQVPGVAVTMGPQGAWVGMNGATAHIPAFACDPLDLTGAGDAFAGAYLYGLSKGMSIDKAARAANYIAMQVITHLGARLSGNVKEHYEHALNLPN